MRFYKTSQQRDEDPFRVDAWLLIFRQQRMTNEFRLHVCATVGRSFAYMQKSNSDRIAPCGTPWVIGRAANNDDPMRTF